MRTEKQKDRDEKMKGNQYGLKQLPRDGNVKVRFHMPLWEEFKKIAALINKTHTGNYSACDHLHMIIAREVNFKVPPPRTEED